jgi:competence protein ComEA
MGWRKVWGGWVVFAVISAPSLPQLVRHAGLDTPAPPLPVTQPAADAATAPARYRSAPLTYLNTAPTDSLRLLPGIGPVLAARIADARSGQRPFSSWDDLRERVSGIGVRTVARLRYAAEPRPRPVGFWLDSTGVASD